MPADWKVSIADAEPQTKDGKPAAQLVKEVEPGVHYSVRLQAKGEVRVASVVVPAGEIGENTTARWTVEGLIGDELLGGMMQELHVPALLADLELPPTGSTTKPAESLEAASTKSPGWLRPAGIAAVFLLLLGAVVMFWRRSRQKA